MIEGFPISDVGPAGLLAAVVILLLLGRIVPRRSLEDVLKDRDGWHSAHTISEQARVELQGQVKELLEHAKTTDAFIRSLPHATPQDGQHR